MKERRREGEKDREAKMHIADVGKTVDLFYAAADLYCTEKHIEHSLMIMQTEIPDSDKRKEKLIDLYMEMLNEVRKARAAILKRIVKNTKWDAWCFFKHISGAIMQIHEVATREIYQGNLEEAKKLIGIASKLWVIFWLNNKVGEMWDKGEEEFLKWIEEMKK